MGEGICGGVSEVVLWKKSSENNKNFKFVVTSLQTTGRIGGNHLNLQMIIMVGDKLAY